MCVSCLESRVMKTFNELTGKRVNSEGKLFGNFN